MYTVDFHLHSNYSADSIMNVRKMIDVARKMGLRGIAITDHNNIIGGQKGLKLNKYQDFDVICGAEMDSEEGHIIGLFLNEEIQTNYASEIIDEIRDQGGISVLAHPFKSKKIISKEVLEKVDCIEAFNSRISQQENLKAQQLAKELDYPTLAGSDAHFYFEIGNSGVIVNEYISDLEDLRKAILKKNTTIYGRLTPVPSQILSKIALEMRMHVSDRFTTRLFGVFR